MNGCAATSGHRQHAVGGKSIKLYLRNYCIRKGKKVTQPLVDGVRHNGPHACEEPKSFGAEERTKRITDSFYLHNYFTRIWIPILLLWRGDRARIERFGSFSFLCACAIQRERQADTRRGRMYSRSSRSRIKPGNGSTKFKCVERASGMMTTDESKRKETTVNQRRNGVSELLFVKCIRLYPHEMSALFPNITVSALLFIAVSPLNGTGNCVVECTNRASAFCFASSRFCFISCSVRCSYHSRSDVAKSLR